MCITATLIIARTCGATTGWKALNALQGHISSSLDVSASYLGRNTSMELFETFLIISDIDKTPPNREVHSHYCTLLESCPSCTFWCESSPEALGALLFHVQVCKLPDKITTTRVRPLRRFGINMAEALTPFLQAPRRWNLHILGVRTPELQAAPLTDGSKSQASLSSKISSFAELAPVPATWPYGRNVQQFHTFSGSRRISFCRSIAPVSAHASSEVSPALFCALVP